MMVVENNSKVKVEYEGKLEDGTIFDSSQKAGKPLDFEMGQKQIIPGFESAILGMDVGDEKEVVIEPKDAYGEYNDQLIKVVPKEQIPSDQKIDEGMVIGVQLSEDIQIPAVITKITDDDVTIDLNHFLAGKTLTFKIKILEIN